MSRGIFSDGWFQRLGNRWVVGIGSFGPLRLRVWVGGDFGNSLGILVSVPWFALSGIMRRGGGGG
jgi:hypothetical protein